MKRILYLIFPILLLAGCREEVTIFLPEHVSVAQPEFTDIEGFYLLCEGNMGWNKATLDYYDYAEGDYIRNIFSYANPTVPKEMGDVGNDIGIYGSNMYCVINCSNKIIAVPKGTGQYRWMMMNVGIVKIRGIDVSARTTLRLPADVILDINLQDLCRQLGRIHGAQLREHGLGHRCGHLQGGAPFPRCHQPVLGQG